MSLEFSILDMLAVRGDVHHSAEGWRDKWPYARATDANLDDAIAELVAYGNVHDCEIATALEALSAKGHIAWSGGWATITPAGRAAREEILGC